MEWVETTGRTVEDAKEAALDQLGVDEQDAEFEIVEEPRFGLFGRLRSEARVRARVRPTRPRPKEERRDRRGRHRATTTTTDATPASDDQAPAAAGQRSAGGRSPDRPSRAGGTGDTSRPAAPAGTSASSGDDAEDVDAAGGSASHTSRRRRPGRAPGSTPSGTARETADNDADASGDGDDAGVQTPRDDTTAGPRARSGRSAARNSFDDRTTSPGGGMDVSLDEQGVVAREFLDGLVERLSIDAEIVISHPEEETIELNLQGQDLGLLIGPKGSTLLAIQDLTRTVVQRKTSAANGRILVDVAGYRRKRKDALARFSRQVAEEVQVSGSRRVLEPMSAADRKIVHDTVNEIEGVMTISEGEDPQRRVVILPAPADS